jgi:hypothetical protein
MQTKITAPHRRKIKLASVKLLRGFLIDIFAQNGIITLRNLTIKINPNEGGIMNSLKKLWDKLQPGDVIISKKLDPSFQSIVLEKNKDGIILSPFCPIPLIVELYNMPMRWSEDQKAIINAKGQTILEYQSIEIKKNVYPTIPEKYKALKKHRNLNPDQMIAIEKANEIKMIEIDTLIKFDTSNQVELMSLILNRVFGPEGYSDDQLVILAQVIATYESMINGQKDIITKKQADINSLNNEADKVFNQAVMLLNPPVWGVS